MAIQLKGVRTGNAVLQDGIRTIRKTLVFFSDEGDGVEDLLLHDDFPAEGETLDTVSGMRCSVIRILPEVDGAKRLFRVECTYSNETGVPVFDTVSCGDAFNVSVRPVENVVPFETAYNISSTDDAKTVPVQTTSGTPIYATTCVVSSMLKFSYYLRSFDPSWVIDLTDTLNKDDVTVCGIKLKSGHGLIRNITASCKVIRNSERVQVDMEIELSHTGFYRTFANRSTYCIDSKGKRSRIYMGTVKSTGCITYGSYGDLKNICDLNCPLIPVDEEIWLLQNGSIDPNISSTYSNFTPHILKFREKRMASWSCLSIPVRAGW